jgi:hypothetical protein
LAHAFALRALHELHPVDDVIRVRRKNARFGIKHEMAILLPLGVRRGRRPARALGGRKRTNQLDFVLVWEHEKEAYKAS